MDYNVDLDVYKEAEFNIDLNIDTEVNYTKTIDVDNDYNIDVDIDGNEAVFNVDVQAFGEDTSTELNLVVVTNDDWSSILATGYSAVA